MKYEKYEKPDLEELEIILEGSYLNGTSPGVGVESGEGGGGDGEYGDDNYWD